MSPHTWKLTLGIFSKVSTWIELVVEKEGTILSVVVIAMGPRLFVWWLL